ncbi:hypothetical protein [Bacillus tequilensis]|uniref:hypothetical protein n=1 Tax=Bacillus tequilensis TaxID=227866 RepID=UPI00046508A3|nr:hypothetical protein [Bacillus tequilensis]
MFTILLMFMPVGGGCKPAEKLASPAPSGSAKNKAYDIHDGFIEAERIFGTEAASASSAEIVEFQLAQTLP